jgi:hypothetical protein
MEKSFFIRATVATAIFLCFLAIGAVAPGRTKTSRSSTGAHVVKISPNGLIKAAGVKAGFMQHKLEKVRKSIEAAKKISVQREAIKKMLANQKSAERKAAAKRMLDAQKNQVYILGKPTKFLRAPSTISHSYKAARGMKRTSLTSPVLINGKHNDTLEIGQPFDLTFSFSPGFVSASLNIYLDANHDSILNEGDIKVSSDNILVLDNGSLDADPTQGVFRHTFTTNETALNYIAGTLIFEVNDYQSAGTATVTFTQPQRASVIEGSIEPALPNMIVEMNNSNKPLIICADSSGKFTANVDMVPPYYLNAALLDLTGVSNDYILPNQILELVRSDTAIVTFKLDTSKAFVEGELKGYDGNPIPNGIIWASNYDGLQRSVMCKTDSSGHFHVGLAGGTWILSVSTPDTDIYLQSPSQMVLVPNSGTINVDITIPKANSTISGKVTLNSSGLGGVPIYAYAAPYSNSALTGADGTYSIPVFDPGEYEVEISINDGGYYPDNQIFYSERPGSSNVNFHVFQGKGGIDGTVTDSTTTKPIAGAMIEIESYSYNYNYFYLVTDDSGYYHLPLADGTCYLYVYGKGYFTHYEYFTVSGQVITKNISLQPSGMISGKIADSKGRPLGSVYVTVCDTLYNYVSSNYSDYDGTYYVDGLFNGRYKAVAVSDNHITQWYNKAADYGTATAISVITGKETSGIDFSLNEAGKISGNVTDKKGSPVPYADVTIFDSLYNSMSYCVTDDSGKYLAGGLGSGNYYVEVTVQNFAVCWYNGKSSYALADKVPVTVGQETQNINFTLIHGASISGRITNESFSPISYGDVYVIDTVLTYQGSSYVDYDGTYKIPNINPGKYYVYAEASTYATRWYKNAASIDSASLISLSDGEDLTDVNFVLPAGGSISGTVLDANGNPLASASVYAYEVSGMESMYGYVDYLGNYTISGLSGSKYFVTAYAPQHAQQWYNHKSSFDEADTVNVQAESITTGVNFNLAAMSGIFGYITDDLSSYGIGNMVVSAFNATGDSLFYAASFSDGSYSLSLPDGKYTIGAFDPASFQSYLPSFYSPNGPVSEPSVAGTVSIVSTNAQTEMDFRLKRIVPCYTFNKSNLEISFTNTGRLGIGDSTLPSCRWPSNSSKNYLFEGDLVVAGVPSYNYPYVFGGLFGSSIQGWGWNPILNYNTRSVSGIQVVETAFVGELYDYYYVPEFTIQEKCYTVSNANFDIIIYKIKYNGLVQGRSFPLKDVYIGQFLDFDVSPAKDLVGRSISDTLIYIYDSTNSSGVNIGARLLSGKPARICWWRSLDDPESDTALYNVMKTDTSTSIPNLAGDQRLFISSGPYSIDAGDSLTFAFAIIAQQSSYALTVASRLAASEYQRILTDVKDGGDANSVLPTKFALHQNYPNPFNPSTTISFDLPAKTHVRLYVYNVLGQLVTTLFDGEKPAGHHSIVWNADNLASGIYFCRIESEAFTHMMKMLLMK